eukprot:Polyplicarium_translucidae@DN3106_c0_g1_i2.p1
MRRVSIAIELIDDPALLLLDEPTSGLDSNLAYDLVNTLWDISRTGRTVVVSVHQPRSQLFSLFDSVVVLSGGKLVFQGPSERVKPYFSSIGYDCPADYNPADFIIELLSPADDGGKELPEKDITAKTGGSFDSQQTYSKDSRLSQNCSWKLSEAEVQRLPDMFEASVDKEAQQYLITETLTAVPPIDSSALNRFKAYFHRWAFRVWWSQFATLFIRCMKISLRNPVLWIGVVLIHVVDAAILGGVFWDIRGPVRDITFIPFVTPDTLEQPWVKYYMEGPFDDGTRPLLDAFLDGIDGNGSRLILQSGPASDRRLDFAATEAPLTTTDGRSPMDKLSEFGNCTYEAYDLEKFGWPQAYIHACCVLSSHASCRPARARSHDRIRGTGRTFRAR